MAAVENYFRQCSLLVNCRDLAYMAATLANAGVHPVTGVRALPAEHVARVLSVMATCGMYNYAGSWMYEVGMPAKSGVGGGIAAVLPGRFGIGVFSPRLDAASVYIAVAILGATVMPHNLYLHSSLVQTRVAPLGDEARRRSLRFNFIDTLIALNVAFCINASILVLASDVFHKAGIEVTDLREAQQLLSPLLGTGLAGLLFAVALLCAGQSSTITGTLAGQIVMQGFLRLRGSPVLVRAVTRGIAILPAVFVLSIMGEDATVSLLVGTQVVLSLQLPFALVPLIRFTACRSVMGEYVNRRVVTAIAAVAAALVIACNGWLVMEAIGGSLSPIAIGLAIALGIAAVALLSYLALAPIRAPDDSFAEPLREPLRRRDDASPKYQPL